MRDRTKPVTPDPSITKPIIIIGSPRSGTTFIHRVLRAHSTLAGLSEPRLTWRYGNDAKSDMLRPSDARSEVRAWIRTAFATRVHAEGKVRLVEKTPSNSLRMGFVDRIFPDAKFVHILRNGQEAALSIAEYWDKHSDLRTGISRRRWKLRVGELQWKRTPYYFREVMRRALPSQLQPITGKPIWGPLLPGIHAMVRELDVLEIACLQWRMCVEAACHYGRRLPADRYMEIRLEDLDAVALKNILDFCELASEDSVTDTFTSTFDSSQTSRRGTTLPPEERECMLDWLEPTLLWLGYL